MHFNGTYFTFNIQIHFFCIVLLALSSSYLARANCDWTCDNGDCIDNEYLCDGVVQCRDGSDEIAENCYTNTTCPEYAFRCAYGACIAGSERCNRKPGCADHSDELPFMCQLSKLEVEAVLRGKCGELEMQCRTGECIDSDQICDGIRNCADGDDESLEVCAPLPCQSYALKCAYGACIDGSATCNGSAECHDGSDESYALCGGTRKPGVTTQRPTIIHFPPASGTTGTTTIGTTPYPVTINELCELPSSRANVIVRDETHGTRLEVHSRVATNSILSFACSPGYTLVGAPVTLCMSHGWKDELPICTKYCNATTLREGFSTKASCYYEEESVRCENIRPGTRAEISCETEYYRDTFATEFQYRTLHCTTDYRWNHPKTPCKMRCGYVQPPSKAFAKNGVQVNITEVPWHVGVYSRLDENRFKRTCGGSIISPRIVLSAAHCFWDKANSELYDASYYSIAAGKYFTDYDSTEEHFPVQKSAVAEIFVENFNGLSENYRNDLAIVKLTEHFKFTHSIKPICVRFLNRAQAAVDTGTIGFIVGWGPTQHNNNAEVLQKVDMSTVSYHQCRDKLSINGAQYDLPDDKFCVTRASTTGDICRGDSGGAFVIRERNDPFYRLVGVVSHAPLKVQDCGKDGLVALTNVQFFETVIQRFTYADLDRISPYL